MGADLLREAAAALRTDAGRESVLRQGDNYWDTEASVFERRFTPAVALAVADLLDAWVQHDLLDSLGSLTDEKAAVLSIAHAYLGRES